MTDGIVLIYCPHTTAGITINENADPDVVHDLLIGLDKAFPDRVEFRHSEGNSAFPTARITHLKASTVGSSAIIIINNGDLLLGMRIKSEFSKRCCQVFLSKNKNVYKLRIAIKPKIVI